MMILMDPAVAWVAFCPKDCDHLTEIDRFLSAAAASKDTLVKFMAALNELTTLLGVAVYFLAAGHRGMTHTSNKPGSYEWRHDDPMVRENNRRFAQLSITTRRGAKVTATY